MIVNMLHELQSQLHEELDVLPSPRSVDLLFPFVQHIEVVQQLKISGKHIYK